MLPDRKHVGLGGILTRDQQVYKDCMEKKERWVGGLRTSEKVKHLVLLGKNQPSGVDVRSIWLFYERHILSLHCNLVFNRSWVQSQPLPQTSRETLIYHFALQMSRRQGIWSLSTLTWGF
jgi:hypothetical protein